MLKQMMWYEDYDEFANEYCKEVIERIKQIMEERGFFHLTRIKTAKKF